MKRNPSRSNGGRARTNGAPHPAPRTRGRVRIVVADDQALDRMSMVALLRTQRDFDVVGEATTSTEAVARAASLSPSVVILSLHISGTDGLEAISAIHAQEPRVHVLAVSDRGEAHCLVLHPPAARRVEALGLDASCTESTECLHLAVMHGALGAVRRDVQPEEFFEAVRAVASGIAWYGSHIAERLQHPIMPERAQALSEREMDVAALITTGRSNKEIATALDISEPTVKKHVGAILSKLGLLDRLQIGLHLARNPMVLGPHAVQRP